MPRCAAHGAAVAHCKKLVHGPGPALHSSIRMPGWKSGADTSRMGFFDVAAQVRPGLWFGPMPAGDWDFPAANIGLLVTLSEHVPPQAARRYMWGTSGDAAGEGTILFIHWPIEDGDLPDERLLTVLVDTVVAAVRAGVNVYVHCFEGRNRSALVAGLAHQQLDGVSPAEALERLRSVRTGVLGNKAFAGLFENW